MGAVSTTLDKTAGWRPADVPLGKALLLLLLMALPGKLTTKVVRYLLGLTGKLTGKRLYQVANFVGPLVGFLEAYGFKKSKAVNNFLGPTGAEYLALGTIVGAIDAGFERGMISELDKDLTDIISDSVRTKIVEMVNAIRGTKLAGFPEAGTSAWREEQKWLGSPKTGRPTQTASPPKRVETGKPIIDPVQQTSEILEAKSRR